MELDKIKQNSARIYIQQNDLKKLMTEMLNSVVYEKSKKPLIYMIKYLAAQMSPVEREKHGIRISTKLPKNIPVVQYPIFLVNQHLKKFLTPAIWNQIKFNVTQNNNSINDVINDQSKYGVYLTDFDALNKFKILLEPMIEKYNQSEFQLIYGKKLPINFHNEVKIYENTNVSLLLEFHRCLSRHNYIINDIKQSREIELVITAVIENLISRNIIPKGSFIKYAIDRKKFMENIEENNIQIDPLLLDFSTLFVSDSKDIFILINELSHFRLILKCQNNVNDQLNKANEIIKQFEQKLVFDYDNYYGYINPSIDLLGSGFSITSCININNLTIEKETIITELLENFQFEYFLDKTLNKLDIRFKNSFKVSEENFLNNSLAFICNILYLLNNQTLQIKSTTMDSKDAFIENVFKAYNLHFNEYKNILINNHYNYNKLIDEILISSENPFLKTKSYYLTYSNFFITLIRLISGLDEKFLETNNHIKHIPTALKKIPSLLVFKNNFKFLDSIRISFSRNYETNELDIINLIRKINPELIYDEIKKIQENESKSILITHNGDDDIKFELFLNKENVANVDLINKFFIFFESFLNKIEYEHIFFLKHEKLGYLTHYVNSLGNGFSLEFEVSLQNPSSLETLCNEYGFKFEELGLIDGKYKFRIVSKKNFEFSEETQITNMIYIINQLNETENYIDQITEQIKNDIDIEKLKDMVTQQTETPEENEAEE